MRVDNYVMLCFLDSPIVEVSRISDGSLAEVVELDSLQLQCDAKANPPVDKFTWYFNVSNIIIYYLV
jgi:hypothetical protein